MGSKSRNVNICQVRGRISYPLIFAYCSSRALLEGIMDEELATTIPDQQLTTPTKRVPPKQRSGKKPRRQQKKQKKLEHEQHHQQKKLKKTQHQQQKKLDPEASTEVTKHNRFISREIAIPSAIRF